MKRTVWLEVVVATVVVTMPMMIIITATLGGCSDSTNPNPNPPRTQQQQASGLSASFVTQCSRCHGERGEGQTVSGKVYPVIPGGKDESAYIATVRGGRGNDMPAFDETQITDADLKADYLWLTTKR